MTQAVIVATNVLCAAGRGTAQVWASIRAGVGRIVNSHVIDGHFDPIRMGLVPEDQLEPVTTEFDTISLPPRARRILRLAVPTFRAVRPDAGLEACPVYLGLPEFDPTAAPWVHDFPATLSRLAGVPIDARTSRTYPIGRAGALVALRDAVNDIEEDATRSIIVGGVDTFLDLRLLGALGAEHRILGRHVMDGFIPGEGAAFLVLAAAADERSSTTATITVLGAASSDDPGHRYGNDPARGEGLADAIETLRIKLGDETDSVTATFAGFNGESFDAKQWGIALLRHKDFFDPAMRVYHPADCFGDTGAATGALLAALAARALSTKQTAGPALVWAASDREPRACAVLSARR
jgi:3-oxoacyl-[acyl-carrier-protein] synthase-1